MRREFVYVVGLFVVGGQTWGCKSEPKKPSAEECSEVAESVGEIVGMPAMKTKIYEECKEAEAPYVRNFHPRISTLRNFHPETVTSGISPSGEPTPRDH